MGNLIYDRNNTYIEHSIVINNFVAIVGSQMNNSLCKVFGNSVKYKWPENGDKPVVPDVSINCDIKNRRATNFLGVPKFIMEVLSDATEHLDRNKKKELYRKVEVAEYWIADWHQRQIEIYILCPDETTLDHTEYRKIATVTEKPLLSERRSEHGI